MLVDFRADTIEEVITKMNEELKAYGLSFDYREGSDQGDFETEVIYDLKEIK